MLKLPHGERLTEEVLGRVCDALKTDSRVHDFSRPRYRSHMVRTLLMYPYAEEEEDPGDELLRGLDHFHAGQLSDPLVFRLSVPRENQEEFRGVRDFPSGDYCVAWDGLTLVVLWEQGASKRVSRAAGRIVFDVLTEACRRAGFEVYAQACEPACENRFSHKNVVLARPGTAGLAKPYPAMEVREVEDLPLEDIQAARYWFGKVRYPFSEFARYKNGAQRIRDLEALVSHRLLQLLDREQKKAVHRTFPWWRRWAANRWLRKNAPATQKLLSDIWLAVGAIEVLRRGWAEERTRFKEAADEWSATSLFALDADDDAAIDSLDLTLARASLDHFASRSDTRTMVLVTALAGAAGLVGAILGAILGAAIAS